MKRKNTLQRKRSVKSQKCGLKYVRVRDTQFERKAYFGMYFYM